MEVLRGAVIGAKVAEFRKRPTTEDAVQVLPFSAAELVDLGINPDIAAEAIRLTSDDEVLDLPPTCPSGSNASSWAVIPACGSQNGVMSADQGLCAAGRARHRRCPGPGGQSRERQAVHVCAEQDRRSARRAAQHRGHRGGGLARGYFQSQAVQRVQYRLLGPWQL
jgi:hypothetical protein